MGPSLHPRDPHVRAAPPGLGDVEPGRQPAGRDGRRRKRGRRLARHHREPVHLRTALRGEPRLAGRVERDRRGAAAGGDGAVVQPELARHDHRRTHRRRVERVDLLAQPGRRPRVLAPLREGQRLGAPRRRLRREHVLLRDRRRRREDRDDAAGPRGMDREDRDHARDARRDLQLRSHRRERLARIEHPPRELDLRRARAADGGRRGRRRDPPLQPAAQRLGRRREGRSAHRRCVVERLGVQPRREPGLRPGALGGRLGRSARGLARVQPVQARGAAAHRRRLAARAAGHERRPQLHRGGGARRRARDRGLASADGRRPLNLRIGARRPRLDDAAAARGRGERLPRLDGRRGVRAPVRPRGLATRGRRGGRPHVPQDRRRALR